MSDFSIPKTSLFLPHLVCAHKASLHGVRVHDAELFSHYHSAAPLFALADLTDTKTIFAEQNARVVRRREEKEGRREPRHKHVDLPQQQEDLRQMRAVYTIQANIGDHD